VSTFLKLSSPATHEFWEISVLFEDEHLLALDKPRGLLTFPDPCFPDRPSLVNLLHSGIAQHKPWAQQSGLAFLATAKSLDFEASGVILFAKSKLLLGALADGFASQMIHNTQLALVQGEPREDRFTVDAKLAPQTLSPQLMRVDASRGKKSKTEFKVLEKFALYTLLECGVMDGRPHQVRVHLRHVGLPVVGDSLYGGRPLLLSRLKPDYRLKEGKTERPLISQAAIHSEKLTLSHPVTGETVVITASWPKDLKVAMKYLRQYAV
jgi:RluA family pseudouridine synthase